MSLERRQKATVGLFIGSMLTGIVTQLLVAWRMLYPVAVPPTPFGPHAVHSPTPAPMLSLSEMPRSLGAAANPRRVQFENHISISQGGKVIPLPVHTGTVDAILGPVSLSVGAGDTVTWNPTSGVPDIAAEVHLVVAFSDVPAEDALHAVVMQGTGGLIHELNPAAYLPEELELPLIFVNNTSRDARVSVTVFLNTLASPTPTGSIDF